MIHTYYHWNIYSLIKSSIITFYVLKRHFGINHCFFLVSLSHFLYSIHVQKMAWTSIITKSWHFPHPSRMHCVFILINFSSYHFYGKHSLPQNYSFRVKHEKLLFKKKAFSNPLNLTGTNFTFIIQTFKWSNELFERKILFWKGGWCGSRCAIFSVSFTTTKTPCHFGDHDHIIWSLQISNVFIIYVA